MLLTAAGVAAFVVAFVVLWRKAAAPKSQGPGVNRPGRLSKAVAAALLVFLGALALLTASGKLHWLAALAAGALPLLRWLVGLVVGPLVGNWLRSAFGAAGRGTGQSTGPQTSTVETADLRMTLTHESGAMDGEVLSGPRRGKRLADLDLETLRALRASLVAADSRQLLDTYLERRFPGWGDAKEPGGEADDRVDSVTPPPMDKAQARIVLGLGADATQADVVAAHRRLMQKLHPDRGGTDYLAATLNHAKEVLLG